MKKRFSKSFLFLLCGLIFAAGIFAFKLFTRNISYPELSLSQHYSAGIEYCKEHLFVSAIREMGYVLKIDPDCKDAYILLGDVYMNSELYPESIKQYLRVLKIDPADKIAQYRLALAYYQMGNYAAAAREFNVMIKNSDSYEIDLVNNLASCYSSIGLYKPALEKYEEILKVDPRSARAYYNIGVIYFNNYQYYKRAIKEWIMALRFDPGIEDARVYINNARILLKEKRYAQKTGK